MDLRMFLLQDLWCGNICHTEIDDVKAIYSSCADNMFILTVLASKTTIVNINYSPNTNKQVRHSSSNRSICRHFHVPGENFQQPSKIVTSIFPMATSSHMLYKLYTCIKESSFMHLDACLSHRSVLAVNMFTANIPVPSPVV